MSYIFLYHEEQILPILVDCTHRESLKFVAPVSEIAYLVRVVKLDHQSTVFTLEIFIPYKLPWLPFYKSSVYHVSLRNCSWKHEVIYCSLLAVIKFKLTNLIFFTCWYPLCLYILVFMYVCCSKGKSLVQEQIFSAKANDRIHISISRCYSVNYILIDIIYFIQNISKESQIIHLI